jgi:hypothetical protein
VSLSFAQRTSEAAVAVLGADITDWPDEHPRRLVDPAYVGVASMVAQGRPGFTLVRTPHVPDDIADQRARRGAHLVRDPVELQTSMCTSPGTSPTAGSWEESGGPFRQESTAALRNTNPHQMEGAGNLDDDTPIVMKASPPRPASRMTSSAHWCASMSTRPSREGSARASARYAPGTTTARWW